MEKNPLYEEIDRLRAENGRLREILKEAQKALLLCHAKDVDLVVKTVKKIDAALKDGHEGGGKS